VEEKFGGFRFQPPSGALLANLLAGSIVEVSIFKYQIEPVLEFLLSELLDCQR
jgi:hypothetical protein